MVLRWYASFFSHTQPIPQPQFHNNKQPYPTIYFRSCTGGKTEDFFAAAKLLYKAGGEVKVPTYLVPATQKVWADVYGVPVPGCDGKTAAEIFEAAGCVAPGAPSCAACLGGPKDTFARMNEPEIVVSTTNRYGIVCG